MSYSLPWYQVCENIIIIITFVIINIIVIIIVITWLYLKEMEARYSFLCDDATLHVVQAGEIGQRHQTLELLDVERLVVPAHGNQGRH